MLDLHRDLLRLRHEDPVFSSQDKSRIEGSVLGTEAFLLRWFDEDGDDRLALFNLGRDIDWYPAAEPMLAAPPDRQWQILWSSDDSRYGGKGIGPYDGRQWHMPGHAAVVFRAATM
jgi:maltooligosyltrehalose trehalohydrolase